MTPSDDKGGMRLVELHAMRLEAQGGMDVQAAALLRQQAEEIARLTRNYQHTYEELQVVRASREQIETALQEAVAELAQAKDDWNAEIDENIVLRSLLRGWLESEDEDHEHPRPSVIKATRAALTGSKS